MDLCSQKCIPCQGGLPALKLEQAQQLVSQLDQWHLSPDAHHIERNFSFADFATALAFVNRVGELAEVEGHHPDIHFGWGYAKVVFYTHKINGLHQNDFIMAAKVDAVLAWITAINQKN